MVENPKIAVYDSSRDVTISGLGGFIATSSSCRSLSQSIGDTFFDVAVVGKLDFVIWITTILILYLFCHISQYDQKISSVSKNSQVFDVMLNNFRCTDWRLDCCIVYPLHIQEKSRKGSAQRWTDFFWLKNWAGGFFLPPSAIRGLRYKRQHRIHCCLPILRCSSRKLSKN